MRSTVVVVLAFALGACGVLDRIELGGSSLDPSKIYLSPDIVVSVSARDTYRYACVDPPLVCVQHGIDFECRCP